MTWAENGLAKLPADSRYRLLLQEARGQALIHLDQPEAAFDELLALFQQQRTVSVYLKLRDAAQSIGRWKALYPQLTTDMQAYVLVETRKESYTVGVLMVAGLLGYAHLLEGDWEKAVEWALNSAVPAGWQDDNLVGTVATGLLRMGLAAREASGDDVLAQALRDAPKIIREQGDRLEAVARSLPADPLLDAAVQLYERLVERAIGGKNRDYYAVAGARCKVIRSIRRMQGREKDFERYYQGLFVTYSRYSALKDELRKAVG